MTEALFESILSEVYEREFNEFNNAPAHKFSAAHKRKMKRLFKVGVPFGATPAVSRIHISKRLAYAAVIIVTAALLCVAVAAVITNGFRFEVKPEYTRTLSAGWEDAPTAIEGTYGIDVPSGFELCDYVESVSVCSSYGSEKDFLVFAQSVKKSYTANYNTEGYEMVKFDLKGKPAFFVRLDDGCILAWDNGDYILEIYSSLDEDKVLALANTAKIVKK